MNRNGIKIKDELRTIEKKLDGRKSYLKHKTAVLFLFIIMTVLLSGCQKDLNYKSTVAFTFDKTAIYLNEMMYHVLLASMQEELYTSYMKEDGKGSGDKKAKELARELTDAAVDNAIKYQLFYEMAIEEGYTLTEEEKSECRRRAESIQKNFGEETLSSYGLSIESVTAIQEKLALTAKYYNIYIDKSDIDKEAIRSRMDQKDYRQFKITYLFGQKEEKELLSTLKSKALTESFQELGEEAGIRSGELTFTAGKDTFGEEKVLEDTVISMKEGEVSEVIETVNGCYLLKLNSDTSEEAFNEAVEEEYNKERNEAAEAGYQSLKAEHSIELNKDLKKFINP